MVCHLLQVILTFMKSCHGPFWSWMLHKSVGEIFWIKMAMCSIHKSEVIIREGFFSVSMQTCPRVFMTLDQSRVSLYHLTWPFYSFPGNCIWGLVTQSVVYVLRVDSLYNLRRLKFLKGLKGKMVENNKQKILQCEAKTTRLLHLYEKKRFQFCHWHSCWSMQQVQLAKSACYFGNSFHFSQNVNMRTASNDTKLVVVWIIH